ncbi:MAG: hypothetical protein ACRETQ_00770, partial [Gammaproteobacteria bacterium]
MVWISANNLQARNDVEILADAGVLHAPIDAWPLPWSAISADLYAANPKNLTPIELGAWHRLMAEMPQAPACFETRAAAQVSVERGQPQLRWYAPAPRGKNDIEGAITSVCGGFYYALDVSQDNRSLYTGAYQK